MTGVTLRCAVRMPAACSGWKPVAITVIFTASPIDSFRMTPKLICTSSHSAASRMIEQASLTSCSPRLAGTGDVDQDAARAGDAGVLEQRATDGLPGRFDRGILAARRRRAHHRVAHADHGGLDVGEVAIDQARESR